MLIHPVNDIVRTTLLHYTINIQYRYYSIDTVVAGLEMFFWGGEVRGVVQCPSQIQGF